MDKKSAIKSLKKQIDLLSKSSTNDDTWLIQTQSLIKDCFGIDSEEYLYIKRFSFFTQRRDLATLTIVIDKPIYLRKEIIQFLYNCIDTIDRKGLYKPKGENFMSLWNLKSVILFMLFVFFIGLCLGAIVGIDRLGKLIPFLHFLVRFVK